MISDITSTTKLDLATMIRRIENKKILTIKKEPSSNSKDFSKMMGKILLGQTIELIGTVNKDNIITLQDNFILDLHLFFKNELSLKYNDSLVFSKFHGKKIDELSGRIYNYINEYKIKIFHVFCEEKQIPSDIQEILDLSL